MSVEIDVPKEIEPIVREILTAVKGERRKRAVKDLHELIKALNQTAPEEIPDTLELLEELRER
ncbi:hypothetical protein A3L11_07900 [Thermococcus siculi]|uniref:Uncharacterized protein n=1 Tax=Thermococcus siculi TaxID=72803 RepID=A0A2Z2MND5_9EURY|nr:hypothetical protein [Thermococcus siculi]ASJ09155.1 hypothetical protein A3L11_07900 [Thermococcus siculi]